MKLSRTWTLQSLGLTMPITFVVVVVVVCTSGCTWVALTPEAAGVQLAATADELEGCTHVGTTKARTKTKVGLFARGEKKVAEELSTLARNDSVEMGGNTVVAEGPVSEDGMQRFAIYDCPSGSPN